MTGQMTKNVIGQAVLAEDCSDVHVINKQAVPVIVMGLHHVVVVASDQGILVADKKASANLKTILPDMENTEGDVHEIDRYRSEGSDTLTSRLSLSDGDQISGWLETGESVTWHVMEGCARVVANDDFFEINEGESKRIADSGGYSLTAGDKKLVALEIRTRRCSHESFEKANRI
ncbi:hypothetical protein [Paenibacillus sp. MBLB4367]|uniref:hypothetical protein n=1 Tax=Paenibacillus sp. MBLB4367 TaxID=3384767 RepID=UPI003908295A